MKKSLCTVLILIITVFSVNAQAYEGSGDIKLNVGFNAYGYGTGLSPTIDFGVSDLFSLGAGVSFYFDNDNDDNFFLFGRGNLHLGETLNMDSQMDLYPGVEIGVVGGDFGIGGYVGFRYFFSDKIGAFIELGSVGSLGLSVNF